VSAFNKYFENRASVKEVKLFGKEQMFCLLLAHTNDFKRSYINPKSTIFRTIK
jgi:hypothetical protein